MDELLNLDEVGQRQLYKSLVCHAQMKMNRLRWNGMFPQVGRNTPAGYGPDDVVNDIVEKYLNGERKCNTEKYSTLEACLKSAIDSEISHMVTSMKQPKKCRPLTGKNGEPLQAYELPGRAKEPVTIVIDQESTDRFREAAMQLIKSDEMLTQIYECIEAEITEPREIAEYLGVDVDEVNNGKKRLRRRLEKMDNQYLTARRRAS